VCGVKVGWGAGHDGRGDMQHALPFHMLPTHKRARS
jgi:hypothetical protein